MISCVLFKKPVQQLRMWSNGLLQIVTVHPRNLFPPTIFADLYQNDPYGRVRILDLYQYTMRKMWYHHSRMGLSLYDSIGQGYLRESVGDVDLPCSSDWSIDPFFTSGSRRLHLRVDSHDASAVTITRNLLQILRLYCRPEVLLLSRSTPDGTYSDTRHSLQRVSRQVTRGQSKGDKVSAVYNARFCLAPRRRCRPRWFGTELVLVSIRFEDLHSISSAWQRSQWVIITRWIGQVSGDETKDRLEHRCSGFRYNSSVLTPVFITRVFQECLTYGGEMDYKSYLDFVLALENRNSPQGLRYLFHIMDIDKKGYLHPGDLNFFYRVKLFAFLSLSMCTGDRLFFREWFKC